MPSRTFAAVATMLATVSAETTFYAAHGLSQVEISAYAEAGCYRGTYGVSADPLTLLTCPPTHTATPFATVPEDTFLCVAELAENQQITSNMSSFLDETDTKVLYSSAREMVLMGPGDQSVRPHACCTSHYEEAVDNVLFVPKHQVYPVKPLKKTNRGTMRAKQLRSADPAERAAFVNNPQIERALEDFLEDNVTENVRFLSTGPSGGRTDVTRNSYAIETGRAGCQPGWYCADQAADEVESILRSLFAGRTDVSIEQQTFRADMCNNVVLKIFGQENPDEYIVSGSHLDSRNTNNGPNASGPAPGADDNASGSAVHLEMARVIADSGLRFRNSIEMMWFCGEEQGLVGSRALATAARVGGQDIIGMFNSDMIGYTDPLDNGGNPIAAYMGRNSSPELSEACKAFSLAYVPDLAVGDTTVCCSDQQAFFENGFQAAGIFETRAGSVRYPQYHQSSDAFDNPNINYRQIYLFGQSIFAGMLEFAEPL